MAITSPDPDRIPAAPMSETDQDHRMRQEQFRLGARDRVLVSVTDHRQRSSAGRLATLLGDHGIAADVTQEASVGEHRWVVDAPVARRPILVVPDPVADGALVAARQRLTMVVTDFAAPHTWEQLLDDHVVTDEAFLRVRLDSRPWRTATSDCALTTEGSGGSLRVRGVGGPHTLTPALRVATRDPLGLVDEPRCHPGDNGTRIGICSGPCDKPP